MLKKILNENNFLNEILTILRSGADSKTLNDRLSDYHDNDIAEAFEQLNENERKALYPVLGAERISEIFSYIEDPDEYLRELGIDGAAQVLSLMDSDDAVDAMDDLDLSTRKRLVDLMDDNSSHDVKLIMSYSNDEIGSLMTTNYIVIKNTLNVRQAMQELISQAGENDNISTVYVTNKHDKFFGAIDLKDLIIARADTPLSDIIMLSYPYVSDHAKIDECIERLKDYAEDSIPVIDGSKRLIGVITAEDLMEASDEELSEDYAKLGGLSEQEDLEESTFVSVKKRLPWLIILLFLGIGVSSIVGIFETVVAILPIVICFQSLILDMAGNVGTQSLAVTIRVLADDQVSGADKLRLVTKEIRIGFFNGLFLGIMAFMFIGGYICIFKQNPVHYAFLISGCVGLSLMVAMVISSLVGTLIPIFFNKIKIDPAVASGPLITTVNDLVAVISYYGLVWILLINVLNMGG
ncbi:magnesium transporter [Coprococcus sp. OM04-5BH]|uniref:magnesium transporter n=1 Tax=Coprococcus sp. OM04-5BH TaxID=2293093 RepID=UPI000E4B73F8|nr:magnesium transporter [Coprococcus sp. OM04-5BH]RHV30839.1 magnesium transporter [Coprococcus sp. OM04-5BH]